MQEKTGIFQQENGKSKQKKYHDSSLPTEDAVGFEVDDHVLIHKKNNRKWRETCKALQKNKINLNISSL